MIYPFCELFPVSSSSFDSISFQLRNEKIIEYLGVLCDGLRRVGVGCLPLRPPPAGRPWPRPGGEGNVRQPSGGCFAFLLLHS